jgi:hypothetical protein
MSASRNGNFYIVKYLVESDTDVIASLTCASKYGHLEIVKYFFEMSMLKIL